MHITIVAGARPNFMKIAPIIDAIKAKQEKGVNIQYSLVHTGQHYDEKMSKLFFDELNIPQPDVNLEVGSGTQAEQTAAIMIKFESYLTANPTDLVLVVGDVTSTMATTIVAKKLCIKVTHVEAGIRSYDMTMPEEVNRLVTDSIADYFFTTTQIASDNLQRSGINPDNIFLVGNTMIDTLLKNMDRLKQPELFNENKLQSGNYIILTLHRPANVDDPKNLEIILNTILHECKNIPLVFPVHPRTRKQLDSLNLDLSKVILSEPLGYLEFNYLVKNAKAVITDSGGITEETTVMHIPCMTLRNSTERPETVKIGTNELLGTEPKNLIPYLQKLMNGEWKRGEIPPLWDGHTSQRIVDHLVALV